MCECPCCRYSYTGVLRFDILYFFVVCVYSYVHLCHTQASYGFHGWTCTWCCYDSHCLYLLVSSNIQIFTIYSHGHCKNRFMYACTITNTHTIMTLTLTHTHTHTLTSLAHSHSLTLTPSHTHSHTYTPKLTHTP